MFIQTLLRDHVKLHARELGRNYRDVLTVKLRSAVEGKCTRHGYVVPNSVAFVGCSCGKLDGASLNGDVVYEVEYMAKVCNPPEKSVVQARVVNVNRFGILAHGGTVSVEDAGTEVTLHVLEIIVAKQGVSLASDVDLNAIRIGDEVQVQILGKRFELNDTKITVIGKIISSSSAVDTPASQIFNTQEVASDDADDDEIVPELDSDGASQQDDVEDGSGSEEEDGNDEEDEIEEDDDDAASSSEPENLSEADDDALDSDVGSSRRGSDDDE
jgi:DNA-directed RNA polymerase subunit E'/Rpb7